MGSRITALVLLAICSGATSSSIATGEEHVQGPRRNILGGADLRSSLLGAVWRRDPSAVPALVDQGVDIDAEIHSGKTALFWAISLGDVDMVKQLIVLGADPNRKTASGDAPLHAAAHLGDALSTAVLLEHQAHVDIRGAMDMTPLHHAAFGDTSEKYDKESLSFALGGHEPTKEVSGDQYISPQDSLLARFQNGRVPNHLAVASLLFASGADPNAVTDAGETPLHFTPPFDSFQVANMIIQSGADIELEDAQKERPLHEAVAYGARGVVAVLLKNGADTYATEQNNLNAREFICHCHSYYGNRALNPCGPNMCMSTYDILVIESMIDKARGL